MAIATSTVGIRRKDRLDQFLVVTDDLPRGETGTQPEGDDATRRCTSDQIERVLDAETEVLLQSRENVSGEQRFGSTRRPSHRPSAQHLRGVRD